MIRNDALFALLMMAIFMLAIIFVLAAIANRVYNYHKDQRRFKRTLRKAPILTVVDFVLDDGTGRAFVEAEDAQISVVMDAHFQSGAFNDATPQLENFPAKHGWKSTGLFGVNKGLRLRGRGARRGRVGDRVRARGVGK